MDKLTETYRIRISKDQWATLKVLDAYGVNVSQFIRNAIKEKIKRDWKHIRFSKERNEKLKLPF